MRLYVIAWTALLWPDVLSVCAQDTESTAQNATALPGEVTLGKGGKLIAVDAETAEMLEAMRRPPRLWARAEFLVWWIRPANFPPLVTTGPFSELRPGALDSLDTQVLFGQSGMDYQHRAGGRFTIGGWLDESETWSMEASYFFLSGRALGHAFESPGAPLLATPFINALTNTPDSSLITFPGVLQGTVSVNAPTFLQGAEANLFANIGYEGIRAAGFAGFRWLNLNEGLRIRSESLVELAPQFQGFGIPFEGNTIIVSDRFDTSNHFYGGQLGARVECGHLRWTLELLGKAAIGVTHQTVTIRGSTSIDTQPAIAANGGLFAVSSNSGRFTQNSFAVAPEAALTLRFRLTERVQLFGGYSFLYWSRVARPADQVDVTINPNFVPTSATFGAAGGPNRPAFAFQTTDFFAHGANFGVEVRY
jgi:hypothetical protein